jgi:hypothetical protein
MALLSLAVAASLLAAGCSSGTKTGGGTGGKASDDTIIIGSALCQTGI